MRKRRIILIVIGASVAAAVIWWALARNPEPSYARRSLSSWVGDMDGNTGDNPDQKVRSPESYKQAEEAIAKMGTNAIPHLIEWAGYRQPAWKRKVYPQVNRVLGKLPTRLRLWDRTDLRAVRATFALSKVTTLSGPVLQLIERLNADPKSDDVFRARIILHGLAERSFEGTMICLTNQSRATRSFGILQVPRWPTNAHAAVPLLIKHLKDSDLEVARKAALVLGRLRMEPVTVVPWLMEALQDARAPVRESVATSLGRYGAEAESALPALTEATNDSDANVRTAARTAMTRIKQWR